MELYRNFYALGPEFRPNGSFEDGGIRHRRKSNHGIDTTGYAPDHNLAQTRDERSELARLAAFPDSTGYFRAFAGV